MKIYPMVVLEFNVKLRIVFLFVFSIVIFLRVNSMDNVQNEVNFSD